MFRINLSISISFCFQKKKRNLKSLKRLSSSQLHRPNFTENLLADLLLLFPPFQTFLPRHTFELFGACRTRRDGWIGRAAASWPPQVPTANHRTQRYPIGKQHSKEWDECCSFNRTKIQLLHFWLGNFFDAMKKEREKEKDEKRKRKWERKREGDAIASGEWRLKSEPTSITRMFHFELLWQLILSSKRLRQWWQNTSHCETSKREQAQLVVGKLKSHLPFSRRTGWSVARHLKTLKIQRRFGRDQVSQKAKQKEKECWDFWKKKW